MLIFSILKLQILLLNEKNVISKLLYRKLEKFIIKCNKKITDEIQKIIFVKIGVCTNFSFI